MTCLIHHIHCGYTLVTLVWRGWYCCIVFWYMYPLKAQKPYSIQYFQQMSIICLSELVMHSLPHGVTSPWLNAATFFVYVRSHPNGEDLREVYVQLFLESTFQTFQDAFWPPPLFWLLVLDIRIMRVNNKHSSLFQNGSWQHFFNGITRLSSGRIKHWEFTSCVASKLIFYFSVQWSVS